MAPTVAHLVDSAAHAGALEEADVVGEASGGERLVVRIGLWFADGRVARARFRATTCASLIAFAEAACRLLEDGTPPKVIDSGLLRRSVHGAHPSHFDRAALVADAVTRSMHIPATGEPR
jgi:hypothetical protein